MYSVKEIYYTLQGEGANVGRPAVFCRFAGCNLWSGQEDDRPTATCQFCDTDFVGTNGPGGGRFCAPQALVNAVAAAWPHNGRNGARRLVVCTGGEPLLQLDDGLIEAFHRAEFDIAIETNGTLPAPRGLDWICVSPKAHTDLAITAGNELKLVFPQPDAQPERFEHLDFAHFFIQPMAGPALQANTERALQYCLDHPRWRLSVQVHKMLGIR